MSILPTNELLRFIRWVLLCSLFLSGTIVLFGLHATLSPVGVLVGCAYLIVSLGLLVVLFSMDPAQGLTRALWVSAAVLKFPMIFLFLFLCSIPGLAFISGVVAGILTFVPAAIISEALRQS